MTTLVRPPHVLLLRRDPVRDPRCPACDHELAGSGGDRPCPECGAAVADAFAAPPLADHGSGRLRRMRRAVRGLALAAAALTSLPWSAPALGLDLAGGLALAWGLGLLACAAAWDLAGAAMGARRGPAEPDPELVATGSPLRAAAIVCAMPVTMPLLALPALLLLHAHALALARRTRDATLDEQLGDAALRAALVVCVGPVMALVAPTSGEIWLALVVLAALPLARRWAELAAHLGVAACWAEAAERADEPAPAGKTRPLAGTLSKPGALSSVG